jgi:hypothetical protein
VPPDDFFDEDWEEPSQTQETAVTRPAPGAQPPRPDTEPKPPPPRTPRAPRVPAGGRLGGLRGRGPGRPRRPGGPDGSQLEYGRLAMLGAGILVLILVGWWAVSRGGGGDPTKAYFTKVSGVLTKSDAVGKQFNTLLNTPGITAAEFKRRLDAEVATSNTLLQQAQSIKPTSQLSAVHAYLLLALQYRVNGLKCLADDVVAATQVKPRIGAHQLARCARRLLASDVIYTDSYANVASEDLRNAHIVAQVPTSRFLVEQDTSLVTAPSFVQVLERLKSGSVSGLHGVQLISVAAEPGGKTLVPGQSNLIHFSSSLAFKVSVQDSGHFQEVGVRVTLTLKHAGTAAITRTATIASIPRGATRSISIGGLFVGSNQPLFTQPYTLTVMAGPVPGEHNKSNNRKTFSVTFSVA